MARLPQTNAEVSYAYVIQVEGVTVGTLQEFSPSQSRTHSYVREILTNGGEPFEIAPGVPTYTIQMSKVRLYESTFLTQFGITSENIQRQVRSISIVETTYRPADIPNEAATGSGYGSTARGEGSVLRTLTYEDCWITDWGKSISVDNVLIIDQVTAMCTRISNS